MLGYFSFYKPFSLTSRTNLFLTAYNFYLAAAIIVTLQPPKAELNGYIKMV